MKAVIGTCVSILMLIAWVGTVLPSDDSMMLVPLEAGEPSSDLFGTFNNADLKPSCTCADIAYMDSFNSSQLAYIHTPEFAEAVRIVACGDSKYSPKRIPIPSSWGGVAMELHRQLAVHPEEEIRPTPSVGPLDVRTEDGGLSLLKEKTNLIPALIFLSSLEYRSRPGHEDASPIFTRIVRTATAELDARMAEKCQWADAFAKRAAAIREMIAEAERLGPGICPPDKLARAKSDLDRACRQAVGVRYSLQETDSAFAQAEKDVDGIFGR